VVHIPGMYGLLQLAKVAGIIVFLDLNSTTLSLALASYIGSRKVQL